MSNSKQVVQYDIISFHKWFDIGSEGEPKSWQDGEWRCVKAAGKGMLNVESWKKHR
ncbi:hypothetical protein P4H39_23405 [Paenibacillus lautus]|uniref:hypothetical protein n=1 Tax=Paenibacillus lautus TaxID=1401 RepID=UPI002DBA3666|nr:hypothetical protein [Paenibacillus lautus]MEC0205560.1 hypothetical protein [Paenibacillus lautus]